MDHYSFSIIPIVTASLSSRLEKEDFGWLLFSQVLTFIRSAAVRTSHESQRSLEDDQ